MSVSFASVSSGKLAYESMGEGLPLVFLHGFSLDRRSWQPQLDHFAQRHRVITYDLRGFGESSLPDGSYEHGADLVGLLDHLEIEKADLVGLSLGANVALSFAAHHPRRVRGLVLASPGLPGYPWKTERPPEGAARVAGAEGVAAGKAFWLAHPLFENPHRPAPMQALLEKMVSDYSAWHWQGEGRGAAIAAPPNGLEGVDVPALVISGRHDVDGYREIARHIAGLLPHAAFEEMADGGHMLNIDAPTVFNGVLDDFFARLPPAA